MATTIEEATREFYAALNTLLDGNAEPMLELWSHADDVTYMSPFGELVVSWAPAVPEAGSGVRGALASRPRSGRSNSALTCTPPYHGAIGLSVAGTFLASPLRFRRFRAPVARQ